MRILFSHRIQSRDGQAVHVEALAAAFRAEGHEILVVGPPAYGRAAFGGGGEALSLLRRFCPAIAYEVLELFYNIPSVWRLVRACARFRPDCIYERYNLFFFGGLALKRLYRLPLHLEINAPLAEERAAHGNLALRRLARQLEAWLWRRADHVYPVTGVLADYVARSGVKRAAITVNQNGFEPLPEPPAAAANGIVTLGFVGFLRPWHGVDLAIAALAGRDDLRLVIAGDGPARAALQRQVAALGLDERVVFLGLVPRDRLAAIVAGFDIAVQPHAVPYASPLKLFEYMAFGRAIVAPDQPNIREILTHGRNALLFAPDDAAGFHDAVARLAADPELRHRLGTAARRDIVERGFTWRGNVRRIAAAIGAARTRDTPAPQPAAVR